MQNNLTPKNNEHTQNKQKYIMIRQPLDKCFNQQQWQQISSQNRFSYLRIQAKIMFSLLQAEQNFNKYFTLFYENHVTLYHWYLLARQNQHDLAQYVFKKLLKRTFQNYKDQVKTMTIKLQQEKQKEKQNHYKMKAKLQLREIDQEKSSKIEDLSQQIFNFMSTKTATASLIVRQKPWTFQPLGKNKSKTTFNSPNNLESSLSKKTNSNKIILKQQKKAISQTNSPRFAQKQHDFHQLYVQTFQACDGYRYIFYNHEKHMKGLNQKDKYNDFIRTQSKSKLEPKIAEYLEEQSILKQIKPFKKHEGSLKCSFQYSSYGENIQNSLPKQKSEIVFRRIGSKNFGKFIRK